MVDPVHPQPMGFIPPEGPFLAGGGFSRESGNETLASGLADFIVFGKLFTSNPDLPARFQKSGPLVDPDPSTFYAPSPKGYTDYGYSA